MSPKRELPSGYKVASDRFDEQKSHRRDFVPRFYLPNDKTAKVVFLDDKPVVVEEHSVRRTSSKGNKYWDRAVSPATYGDPDPLKDAGGRTSTVAYYTIVSLTKYRDSKGNIHVNEKMLLGLKQQAFDVVKRKRARILERSNREQNLVGAVFEVTRGSDKKEPSTGIDWSYVEHMPRKEILALLRKGAKQGEEVSLDPFDYPTVLAPADLALLKREARRLEDADNRDDVEEEDEPPVRRKKVRAEADELDEDEDESEDEEDEEEDAEEESDEDEEVFD